MQWRRGLGVGLVAAGSFLAGVVFSAHHPLTAAQAQTGAPAAVQAQGQSPINEYTLPNGVLCYTLTSASGSFSCVYDPGLRPGAAR